MNRSFIPELVDPQSQDVLAFTEDPSADPAMPVVEGILVGPEGREFPIVDGIPSFVPSAVAEDQTVRSFSQKWEKHQYYRDHTTDFYTQWYEERYDLEAIGGIAGLLSGKQRVLDAGTGSGRDAANFAAATSATVVGVDTAWEALATQAQRGVAENHQLVHADINELPFVDGYFDLINCDQVIHHTPDPPQTFRNLASKLRDGGTMCAYVYRKKAVIREFVDDYVRERIKDLPIDDALEVSAGITALGKAFADLDATVTITEDIPVLGIAQGTYDVQRFLHWNILKCFWNDDFDEFTNNIVNFDWYHPVYCFRYTPEEFRSWFETGWKIEAWDVQEAGISCRAVKVG